MNRYIRIAIEVPSGIIKTALAKIGKGKSVQFPLKCAIAPTAELTIERGAEVSIKSKYRQRKNSHVCVRKNGKLDIGKNVSINYNCMLVCHDSITIGDNVQFSPNVMIYDHDHDFRVENGIKAMKYKTTPIKIGNDVWIGANSVILRGSNIGNNVVIGAGSIVKGEIPDNSILIQKKQNELMKIM